MRKESVQKFDLEAAFKALNEVELPVVKGIRPNREDLQEKFTRKLVTDILVEDYYDVGDSEELGAAQEEREAEIAKAKLARIEKIVDLEAETEEDLLPSYVGKFIIQCPQCMTLFYKNEEDIEKSEENPDVVNINEPCQHCGNSSGYSLIGKVDTVGEDEAAQYDVEDFEDEGNELDLDFTDEDETTEATEDEVATEEGDEEELDLEPIEAEETEEEEEVKESLTEDVDKELDDKLKAHNDYIEYLKNMIAQEEESLKKAENEFVKKAIQRRLDAFKADLEEALPEAIKNEVAVTDLPTPEEVDMEAAAENKDEDDSKEKKESLTEALNLDPAIAARFTKAQLDSLTPEEIKILQNPREREAINKIIAKYNPTKKEESLTEDIDAERKLDAEEAALEKTNAEDYIVEATSSSVMQALDALEAELTEGAELKEAKFEVSDAEFKAMLNNPVFNEGCKKELEEDLPAVDSAPFEKAADAIEAAGSELTPEEQKLEDEELTAKEGVDESLDEAATAVAEPAVETTDLLADDGTMAILIYPDRFTAEERKEKLLADPDFVKTLKAFSTKHKMIANSEDLEDGVSAEEDMYNCTFEGIEGEDLEDTLDELISYYLDIKAGWDGEWKEEDEDNADELTEAPVAAPSVPSKLKRNYSTTELIVKELKADPLFAGLSIRTIQRILLPYYISNMGRGELSTQAMIDFFTEEGFAPYVLDHFFQMDPLARKELLKADAKFMELFNKFAKTYKMFPTSSEEKAPGESDFDFAFSIAFDLDENGVAQDNEIAKETIEAFSRWYVAGKIDGNLVADFWDVVDDFDEKKFNTVTENYLTNVYSNVQSFETTACNLEDNKLIVEGVIKFASGKTKNTTFTYETKKAIGRTIVLEGLNADFASEKAFTLSCKVDTENCLIVESLNYKYTIDNTLVEGLLK